MYNFDQEKDWILTEAGLRQFLAVRDYAAKVFKSSGGVATAGKLMQGARGGDSFKMMACVDKLVDLGEAKVVTDGPAWQSRILETLRPTE